MNRNPKKGSHANKKCYQFTPDGELIKEYNSIVSAADEMEINRGTLFRAIRHNKVIKGYRFQNKKEFDTYQGPPKVF